MEQTQIFMNLGKYKQRAEIVLDDLIDNQIMTRIWEHDHTVWKSDPTEITNRLGWLHIAEAMFEQLPRLEKLVFDLRNAGFTQAVLLGMGGSSLAPEVFRETFGVQAGYLDLIVLDSTDPNAIRKLDDRLNLQETIFIVATKSGGTVETLSFFKYFYNRVLDVIGSESAGKHFIAITDQGSKLEELGTTYRFRDIFLNDPNIGGRYSALSFFGLLPAALLGVNIEVLLERALTGLCSCDSCDCALDNNNYGVQLGAILGDLAQKGLDKLTLITSPEIDSFGNWVEQLIAESTGKEGKGILPVVGEPIGSPDVYSNDRLFVYLTLESDQSQEDTLKDLAASGHPVVMIQLEDHYDLGGQFFLWEVATAVAAHILKINPFDQPNVESAKILAREMVATYQETGAIPEGNFAPLSRDNLEDFIENNIQEGSYLAIQAFLEPSREIETALQQLRIELRDQYKTATTLGFGPRFLHSTGQLHKGDSGKGLFIQLVSSQEDDLLIPDQAGKNESRLGFGMLKNAQAEGDARALMDENRSVIRFKLVPPVLKTLEMF
jgi:glucose-6-phosphate isomerase